jgi:hypothetical protein
MIVGDNVQKIKNLHEGRYVLPVYGKSIKHRVIYIRVEREPEYITYCKPY